MLSKTRRRRRRCSSRANSRPGHRFVKNYPKRRGRWRHLTQALKDHEGDSKVNKLLLGISSRSSGMGAIVVVVVPCAHGERQRKRSMAKKLRYVRYCTVCTYVRT